MKLNNQILISCVLIVFLSFFSSCTKHTDKGSNITNINARIGGYYGDGSALQNEDVLTDLDAFLFQEGVLVKVYDFEVQPSNNYDFSVDSRSGNLYLIGVNSGTVPFASMFELGQSESDWKQLTATLDSEPVQFYTGAVSLEEISMPSNNASVVLTRGLARFDVDIVALESVQIKDITFRNLAQSYYIFPSETVASPAQPERKDVRVIFDSPLTQGMEGLLFAAEQVNESLEVVVTAIVSGVEKEMTKVLSGNIKRNTIYTLTVRQDKIDLSLDLVFDEWEDGGNTDIVLTDR